MRLNESALRQTNRQIANDRRSLERKEKELELEIKKLAKQGHKEACNILIKELLQLRKQKAKNLNISAHMNSINAKNREMYSMGQMASAVGKTTNTMKIIEKQLPAGKLTKNLDEFIKTQERLGMTDKIVSDAFDTMLEESDDDEKQDAIVRQVLDEIGIDLNAQVKIIIAATIF
uniref:SNF7 family protein n=1 Tax=Onchocerca volvulus TaxID=6282 RepID=A0A8R1U1F3_ONCVO